jgi:hypothetical protein
MKSGNSQSLRSAIATATVAALVGLLLIANASTAPAPLQAADAVMGLIFMGTAIWLAFNKQEEG